MRDYESPRNNERRTRKAPQSGQDAGRRNTAARTRRKRRAVGATAISAPGMNALGMSRRTTPRNYGRGETARKVEASRAESVRSRPAVYTGPSGRQSILSRLHLPSFSLSSLSVPTIPLAVVVGLAFVLALAVIAGPARTYYAAWRDAGILHAQYEVIKGQNKDLNHEIDRLQSLEGIEDKARERGYVYPDEEALVVEDVESPQIADPDLVEAAVEEHESSLPWYVGVLDFIFGYSYD